MQVTFIVGLGVGTSERWPVYSPNGPSSSHVAGSSWITPSMTISAVAGTSRSTVSHFTSSAGSPRYAPITSHSQTPVGSGEPARNGMIGSQPITHATGIGSPRAAYLRKCWPQCWPPLMSRNGDVFFLPIFQRYMQKYIVRVYMARVLFP